MKKLLLTCLCGWSVISLSAQHFNLKNVQPETASTSSFYKKTTYKPDSTLFYEWQNNAWEAHVNRTFQYGTNGEVSVTYEKNPADGSIINRLTYAYDSENRLLRIDNERNDNGTYKPQIRETFVYNSKGHRTSFKAEQYDPNNQNWIVLTGDSFVFNYDNQDRIIDYTLYQQSSGQVIPYQKLIWSDFNTDDHPTTLTVQSHSGSFNNYIKLEGLTWEEGYDYANFDPTSYFAYQWDGGNQKWLPQAYDSSVIVNNQRTMKLTFTWNGTAIDTVQRTEYAYDAQGHKEETIVYQKSSNAWTPVDGRRHSKTYGGYDEVSEEVFSYMEVNNQTWVNQEKYVHSYSSLSLPEVNVSQLGLYPNPAKDKVTLDIPDNAQVLCVHLNGKTEWLYPEGKQVNIGHLKSGVYLIRVLTDSAILQSRVIKN